MSSNNNFLLYQSRAKNFPAHINIITDKADKANKIYEVNADFRNILRIFAMLKDNRIPENKRIDLLLRWFYVSPDSGEAGAADCAELVGAFADFVNPNPKNNDNDMGIYDDDGDEDDNGGEYKQKERQFCYDFDAEEIYAGFVSEYGIDLAETEFMHWRKFRILLANLSEESAFKKKIALRFTDISALADCGGITAAVLADITAAKEAVQIPETHSGGDGYDGSDEFERVWDNVGRGFYAAL